MPVKRLRKSNWKKYSLGVNDETLNQFFELLVCKTAAADFDQAAVYKAMQQGQAGGIVL